MFINFYAEWCRFSNLLQPIFDEAADKVREAFPDPGRIVMGKVDCDKECKYTLPNYVFNAFELIKFINHIKSTPLNFFK